MLTLFMLCHKLIFSLCFADYIVNKKKVFVKKLMMTERKNFFLEFKKLNHFSSPPRFGRVKVLFMPFRRLNDESKLSDNIFRSPIFWDPIHYFDYNLFP